MSNSKHKASGLVQNKSDVFIRARRWRRYALLNVGCVRVGWDVRGVRDERADQFATATNELFQL